MPELYFDDFAVGDRFISVGRTITETDVVNFAGMSGDFNPIHLDSEASANGIFGQRVVYGLLVLSIATGLIDRMGLFAASMIAQLNIENWTFSRPAFIGDTVHVELSIEGARTTSTGDRGILRRRISIINQRGETLQAGVYAVMVRRRPHEGVES